MIGCGAESVYCGDEGVYKRTFDYILKTYAVKDPGEMAANSGADFSPAASAIIISSMGQVLEVKHPGGEICFSKSECSPVWPWRLVILNHLCRSGGGGLTGRLITYRELENGHVYYPAFRRESILPLAGRFAGENVEKIRKACLQLGAEMEGSADICARFYFLPRFPVTVKIWLQDEEMEGSANILFDDSANIFLHTEDIAAAGDIVSRFLIKQYEYMYGDG
jgi:hypothetical protein